MIWSSLAKQTHKNIKVYAVSSTDQQKRAYLDDRHKPIAETFENEDAKVKLYQDL